MRVDEIKGQVSKVVSEPSKRYTVHNVNILDASGSMGGGKYKNGVEGINKEIEALKKEDMGVDYTCTVIEFDSSGNTTNHYFMTSLEMIKPFKGRGVKGMTALHETIGITIEKLLTLIRPEDRVVMTITTDGGENDSSGKWAGHKGGKLLKELMEKVKKENNFTITFMGTEQDVESMVRNMGISRGNTISHNNTAEGIAKVYKSRLKGMVSYSKEVSRGLAVTDSFFKGTSED